MKCEKHSFGPWRSNADQMGALMPSADGVTYQYRRECTIMGCSFVEQAKDVVPVHSKTQAKRIAAQTEARPTPRTDAEKLYIVCDGPPGHNAGRFVEVENEHGQGRKFGWLPYGDTDYWRLGPFYAAPPDLEREVADLQARLDASEELARMQAAACMTATFQNTRESAKERIDRSNPYWTQAYDDVCTAVDREMAERERAEYAERALAEARAKERERCAKETKCWRCADAIRALTDEAKP